MPQLEWILILLLQPIPTGFCHAVGCPAQCDYDHVTAMADCSNRNLECIPDNYPESLVMDLRHNSINTVDPNHLNPRLTELILDWNEISDITSLMTSERMENLTTVSVQHNAISVLQVDCELRSLQTLLLDFNFITSLEVPRCGSLERFSANSNLVNGPMKLELCMYMSPSALISLQFNTITIVNVVFNGGHDCNVTLELDNNFISHFNYDNDFGNTKLFHKLSLSHNQVQSIINSNGMLITSIFNIDSNELRGWDVLTDALRYGFPYVQSLSIRGNSFDSLIQPPSWTDELHVLNADGNSLKNLSSESIQGFLGLTELHVSNNQLLFISESALRDLKMLRYLYLDGNPLTSLFGGVFRSQADLLVLSLANCNLNELHPEYFQGLDTLEHLDLSGNQLVQLHSEMFRPLPQIVTMNFSNNSIQNFDLEDCQLVNGLRNLLLARNSISVIGSILGHCDHVETVDLGLNQIEVVPGDSIVGRNPTLSRLELFGNPLQCDCRMASVRDWLQNNPPSSIPLCYGPPGLAGRALTDLATHELACEPPLAILDFKTLQTIAGDTVTLPCKSTGIPLPTASWLDPNGTAIDANSKGRFFITEEMTLHVIQVEKSDQGSFTCKVMNELGETDQSVVHLTVTEKPGSPAAPSSYILPTMFLTLVFTLLAVVFGYFLRKRLEKRSESITTSKAKIDYRKSRMDSVDSSRYVNSVVDDGEVYDVPSETGDQAEDEYEDTASFNEDGPSSAYGDPSSAYGDPSSAYGDPSSAYGDPSSAYGDPSSAYGDPSSAYGGQSSAYGGQSSAYDNTVSLSDHGEPDDYEAVDIGSVP